MKNKVICKTYECFCNSPRKYHLSLLPIRNVKMPWSLAIELVQNNYNVCDMHLSCDVCICVYDWNHTSKTRNPYWKDLT